MTKSPLTLSDAIKQNRLPEFIKQAEARLKELGFGHPETDAVMRDLKIAATTEIKTPQSEDRT